MPEFVPVLNVSSLNGSNGFRLDDQAVGDFVGAAIAGAGDLNKDGFADLIIGAPFSDNSGTDRGLAYLAFGAATRPAQPELAAEMAAGRAYRFEGEAAGDQLGWSVNSTGDVNGDGVDDLIVSAFTADPDAAGGNRGASYLVFGGVARLEAADNADGNNNNLIALANLAPGTGFRFDGELNDDASGFSASGAGDFNGDGVADLIIGAIGTDLTGTDNGSAYLVLGGTVNLNDLDDDDGTADGRINLVADPEGQIIRVFGGGSNDVALAGNSVAAAGDVNGDGFDDVVIGAKGADLDAGASNDNKGAAFIIFGRPNSELVSSLNLDLLDGVKGVRLEGVAAGDQAGVAVNGAGDVNGDGLADVIVGADMTDHSASQSGSAYVVFGQTAWAASFKLSNLDGSNGFRLDGIRQSDLAGQSVSLAGDINGDGFSDLLLASNFARFDGSSVGAAFVVFGKADGFAPVINLATLNGNTGFRIEGAEGDDSLGPGIMGPAGDVNGDGFDDIVVGAHYGGPTNTGAAYVIYGHRAETAVTRIGTEIANRINGGKEDDSLEGRSGADTLIGWEGDDLLNGESGNDTINGGTEDDRATGGGGNDFFLASLGDDTVGGGSGNDTIDFTRIATTAISANLATGAVDFVNAVGSVTVAGVERLIAGNLADTITGNGRANGINGQSGNDTINASNGNDVLVGGAGADALNGGADSDMFDYNAVAETGITAATRDRITGFTINADKIDLATIDAIPGGANDPFAFRGTQAFTAAGQVRLVQAGADTIAEINTVGTSGAEATILLAGITATTMDATEFVL